MGKRKRRGRRKSRKRGDPTLFDLPLHGDNEPDAGEAGVAPPAGPSILFDDDTRVEADDQPDRLDRLKLAMGKTDPPEPEGVVDVALAGDRGESVAATDGAERTTREREPDPTDDRAFLGDRLLGGLADLAAQLIALGLAIAATHAMDIVVTVADWMPFGVLALVFSFPYWTVPLAFWGQTPGMTWVGHTARSTSGEPLSFGQAFMRWFGAILTLALAGLPLLLALTGRSLTDRISGSRTIASDQQPRRGGGM